MNFCSHIKRFPVTPRFVQQLNRVKTSNALQNSSAVLAIDFKQIINRTRGIKTRPRPRPKKSGAWIRGPCPSMRNELLEFIQTMRVVQRLRKRETGFN